MTIPVFPEEEHKRLVQPAKMARLEAEEAEKLEEHHAAEIRRNLDAIEALFPKSIWMHLTLDNWDDKADFDRAVWSNSTQEWYGVYGEYPYQSEEDGGETHYERMVSVTLEDARMLETEQGAQDWFLKHYPEKLKDLQETASRAQDQWDEAELQVTELQEIHSDILAERKAEVERWLSSHTPAQQVVLRSRFDRAPRNDGEQEVADLWLDRIQIFNSAHASTPMNRGEPRVQLDIAVVLQIRISDDQLSEESWPIWTCWFGRLKDTSGIWLIAAAQEKTGCYSAPIWLAKRGDWQELCSWIDWNSSDSCARAPQKQFHEWRIPNGLHHPTGDETPWQGSPPIWSEVSGEAIIVPRHDGGETLAKLANQQVETTKLWRDLLQPDELQMLKAVESKKFLSSFETYIDEDEEQTEEVMALYEAFKQACDPRTTMALLQRLAVDRARLKNELVTGRIPADEVEKHLAKEPIQNPDEHLEFERELDRLIEEAPTNPKPYMQRFKRETEAEETVNRLTAAFLLGLARGPSPFGSMQLHQAWYLGLCRQTDAAKQKYGWPSGESRVGQATGPQEET